MDLKTTVAVQDIGIEKTIASVGFLLIRFLLVHDLLLNQLLVARRMILADLGRTQGKSLVGRKNDRDLSGGLLGAIHAVSGNRLTQSGGHGWVVGLVGKSASLLLQGLGIETHGLLHARWQAGLLSLTW